MFKIKVLICEFVLNKQSCFNNHNDWHFDFFLGPELFCRLCSLDFVVRVYKNGWFDWIWFQGCFHSFENNGIRFGRIFKLQMSNPMNYNPIVVGSIFWLIIITSLHDPQPRSVK